MQLNQDNTSLSNMSVSYESFEIGWFEQEIISSRTLLMQMWNMKKLCIKWSQMYNNDVFIYTSLRSFRSVSQVAVSRYFWHTQFPQKQQILHSNALTVS
jgi:hypothetical protein